MKKILTLSAIALTATAINAHAAPKFNLIKYTVGAEAYNETYREQNTDGSRFMQEKGAQYSLNLAAEYAINPRDSIEFQGRYSSGQTDYTGAYNSANSHYGDVYLADNDRRAYDLRAYFKSRYGFDPTTEVYVKAGIGHRELKDINKYHDIGGYDRTNKLNYISLSVGADKKLKQGYIVSPELSYNHVISGRQYSYLDDETDIHRQKGGKGFEAQVLVGKKLANGSTISVGPFYRGWNIDRSEINYHDNGIITLEPKNNTKEIGIKVQSRF